MLRPGHDDVVDLDRAGSDLDRPIDTTRFEADVDISARPVEGLRRSVVDADSDPDRGEAPIACRSLRRRDQRRCDTCSPVAVRNLDVLQLRRFGQREMEVAKGSPLVPRDQVEPVTLVQARETENFPDLLNLSLVERPNFEHRTWISAALAGDDSVRLVYLGKGRT